MSTADRYGKKPDKPSPDFPLFAHTGRWAKKIKGKRYYFGKWGDPDAALAKYLREKDYLFAGQLPPDTDGKGTELAHLCNLFLLSKQESVDRGDLGQRTYLEYRQTCREVVSFFGKAKVVEHIQPLDFEGLKKKLGEGRNVTTLGNTVQRTRTLFKWAYDLAVIDRPLRFGAFKKPAAKLIRKMRIESGRQDFQAAEIRHLIGASSVQMKAMILLGVNCGFGNDDVSKLTFDRIDIDSGWHSLHREKTFVERRCPLWPETVKALNDAIESRKQTTKREFTSRVFVTRLGNPWVQHSEKGRTGDRVTRVFGQLKRKCSIDRPGVGFYGLRRTYETVGGGSKDQVAVDFLMGHAPRSDDMAARYRQGIEDDRLIAVSEHIREWLFSGAEIPTQLRHNSDTLC
jgi:integrase